MRYLLLLLALFGAVVALRHQSIAVRGKLLCGTRPGSRVRVKLWDEDEGMDPDDELAAGYTDASGMFTLSGGTSELTTIDPVLKVYHDCDDTMPGYRKVKFYLPKSYITDGRFPKKTFDIDVRTYRSHRIGACGVHKSVQDSFSVKLASPSAKGSSIWRRFFPKKKERWWCLVGVDITDMI